MNSLLKKCISTVLALVMVIAMIPIISVTSSADTTYPVMEAYNAASSGDYHKYFNKVVSVTFLDHIDYSSISAADTIDYWDVSANKDESVLAWMKLNEKATAEANADRYDVYIAGEGGVAANPDSSYIFYCFFVLESVNGLEYFKTDNVTTFSRLFEKCYVLDSVDFSSFNTSNVENLSLLFSECKKLVNVDFSNWNTSKVTNMSYMFNNCAIIPEIDISSFDTRNVTNMDHMFYKCEGLVKLYTGNNWSVEAVTNGNAMFNCCYVIEGKIPYDDYGMNDETYATTDHYLTDVSEKPLPEIKKYTVKYEFIGDVPESVTLPSEKEYEEGSTVIVEETPSADGYVFSGWYSEDADLSADSFTITNDVTIKGVWEKVYNIYYVYTGVVPEGAPKLNSYKQKANKVVAVDDIPFVDGYTFIGWSTEDVIVSDGIFTMPENDIVFTGYFKKPVESVEINGEEFILNINSEKIIEVTVKPEDATVKELVFETSDENIVTVDKNGKITAVGEGTAIITVYSKDDPTKKDTIEVKVKIPAEDISVNFSKITLNKGASETIDISVTPDNTTNKEVEFSSTDSQIVSVDKNGKITAVGEGTATIIITSKDNPALTESVSVTVKNPVTEVFAGEDFTLNIGEEKLIDATVNEDATNKDLLFESANPDIVKVDNDGNVIAVGEGTAIISVTSKDNPDIKDFVAVTVKIPVNEVIINTEDTTLNINDEITLDISINPENATDKNVTYESSDEDVAKVDTNGKITAVGEGTAIITVTSKDDPSKTDTITVNVKIPVAEITVDKTEIELIPDAVDKINASVLPGDATDKEIEFISSDENVVTVDKYGNVKAIADGTAMITVQSKADPSVKKEISVTVKTPEPEIIPVIDIVVNKTEIELTPDAVDKINVSVLPEDATDKEIEFISSDENVVTVDKYGNVKAIADGIATITVKSKSEPSVKKVITVSVKTPDISEPDIPEYVITVPDKIIIFEGTTKFIEISISPEGSNLQPSYTSSDESVITVDSSGNIIALKQGTANITVDFGSGDVRIIPVTVIGAPAIPVTHYVCFGKTDGIGWYEVSVNGGDFFPQGPNSTLEVQNGSILVIRVQDMWINDEFDFYVNGKKVKTDAANTITVKVEGYMLIGALSMDIEVPDVEESLSLLEKLIHAIKAFFDFIFNLFR